MECGHKPDISHPAPAYIASPSLPQGTKVAERVGFEPTVPVSQDSRFRVGPVMTTSVPLQIPLRIPSAPVPEKILEYYRTSLLQNSSRYLYMVI